MKKQKKIFVLDTNVLLHDFRSIYAFKENNIVIPIVVLEDLDKLSDAPRGKDHYHQGRGRNKDGVLARDPGERRKKLPG